MKGSALAMTYGSMIFQFLLLLIFCCWILIKLLKHLKNKKRIILKSSENIINTVNSDIPHSMDQSLPVACFAYGHLIRLIPEPSPEYHKHIDIIMRVDRIQSDSLFFDLTDVQSIRRIPTPNYSIHAENRIDKQIGICGNLEYILKEKSDQYFNEGKKELSIACAEKAVELMRYSDNSWSKSDYQLIVWRLNELGEKEFADRLSKWINENILTEEQEIPLILSGKIEKELSKVQKEIIIVKNISIEDMIEYDGMPFFFDSDIKKFICEDSHPFAYMDLSPQNQSIAKEELEKVNQLLKTDNTFSRRKRKPQIPISEIQFSEYNDGYGYTKIMCTPKTITGRAAKYPFSLFFCTRLDQGDIKAHGELVYGKDGMIQKAGINIWRGNGTGDAIVMRRTDGVLKVKG